MIIIIIEPNNRNTLKVRWINSVVDKDMSETWKVDVDVEGYVVWTAKKKRKLNEICFAIEHCMLIFNLLYNSLVSELAVAY